MNMKTVLSGSIRRDRQRGLTLVELMVAITLSFVVVLAGTALFASSKSSYVTQESGSILNDTGRYALENISRTVRQSAYENWDAKSEGGILVLTSDKSANLSGLDAKSLKDDQTSGISSTVAAVNGSDVLAVRFFGSGPATKPDGTIVDCAGFPISEPASPSVIEQDRGWSIYYVAVAPDGVPELRCRIKKDGASTWSSHAIARGIESFQVLYGFNSDGDRIPNQYMTATAVTAKDGSLTPAELNAKTAWKKISGIKVALLISGSQNARSEQPASLYCLFGDTGKKPDGTLDCLNYDYASDAGTKITESSLASANRTRRVFNATILFRNPIEGNAK